MSQHRRTTGPVQRRHLVERLAERRAKEEDLVAAAADALERRAAAQAEIDTADEALRCALDELTAMGFSLDTLADVLGVGVADLR